MIFGDGECKIIKWVNKTVEIIFVNYKKKKKKKKFILIKCFIIKKKVKYLIL